jgi:formylglycine-generating enzyme required for sulfatase activity
MDTHLSAHLKTLTNSIGMEFVLILPGEFMMGAPDDDPDAQENEKPQHKVVITKPFYLGKYPVTQGQWLAVMGKKPRQIENLPQSVTFAQGDSHPAILFAWDEMLAFIQSLNSLDPRFLHRLPTEAQWEYACRAGTTTRWFCGDDETELHQYAWYLCSFMDDELRDYYDNVHKRGMRELDEQHENYLKTGKWEIPDSHLKNFDARKFYYLLETNKNIEFSPQPVGRKLPNPWGLYDMLGNVCECCNTALIEYIPPVSYYAKCSSDESLLCAPDDTESVPPTSYVQRGGCYKDDAAKTRASARESGFPGFRLACTLTDLTEPGHPNNIAR